LPATSSFVGEFLIILGCFEVNSWTALLSASGMVLGAGYSLWLLNRLLFGNIKRFSITKFRDLTRFEFYLLFPFVLLTFILGLFPEVLINFMTVF
jgi:NADH-quinone oxidoreductase subunit M